MSSASAAQAANPWMVINIEGTLKSKKKKELKELCDRHNVYVKSSATNGTFIAALKPVLQIALDLELGAQQTRLRELAQLPLPDLLHHLKGAANWIKFSTRSAKLLKGEHMTGTVVGKMLHEVCAPVSSLCLIFILLLLSPTGISAPCFASTTTRFGLRLTTRRTWGAARSA